MMHSEACRCGFERTETWLRKSEMGDAKVISRKEWCFSAYAAVKW